MTEWLSRGQRRHLGRIWSLLYFHLKNWTLLPCMVDIFMSVSAVIWNLICRTSFPTKFHMSFSWKLLEASRGNWAKESVWQGGVFFLSYAHCFLNVPQTTSFVFKLHRASTILCLLILSNTVLKGRPPWAPLQLQGRLNFPSSKSPTWVTLLCYCFQLNVYPKLIP